MFATGLFTDVRVEVEGEVLVVVVAERPAIAQIDFVGMKEFPADKVRKAFRENNIAEGRTYDKAVIDQAEQEIKRQYLATGRYGVTVTTTITPLDRNRVAVNFTIDEGEVAKIRAINIVGNHAFGEKELLELDAAPDAGLAELVYQERPVLAPETVGRPRDDPLLLPEPRLPRLQHRLDAGVDHARQARHLHRDQRRPRARNIPSRHQARRRSAAARGRAHAARDTIKPGEPFSRERLADSTRRITERLGNEGYAFANANAVPDVDKEKRTVAFTIMIDPGRRVYVRRINIVGNTKTRDEVIRREFRQLEGAFYDGQKLQDSRKRVDRLGYFDGVELETEPVTGTTDQVDVSLKVKEKPTGAVLFGLGFSSSDQLIVQGSISQSNIFGSGKAITLNANTSSVNRNIGLAYTNPYFTVDGVSAGFSMYNRRFDAARSRSATTSPRR